MDASLFISRRLNFRGNVAVVSIAVSFLVVIIAVAVSSGFRREIRNGLSGVSGDVQLTPPDLNVLNTASPIDRSPSYLPYLQQVDGVSDVVPVVYRAGIVKTEDNVHGVLFKGVEEGYAAVAPDADSDSVTLAVAVPRRLSLLTGLREGDAMTAFFIGDRVRMRRFNIVALYDALVETDDRLVVYADLADMQRIDGWSEDDVSAIEIRLDASLGSEEDIVEATQEIGAIVNVWSSESEAPVVAVSSVSRYPQLYDWLDLIDFNVFFILLLMTIVAGFNMVSGLLIMLFENISTIGILKALGMTDRAISKSFLASAAVTVLKGMAAGNAIALLFCIVQDRTHILKLDPSNYFVPFVPVHVDWGALLLADVAVFAVIMLVLLIPLMFISRIDPAETVRMR